MTDRRTLVLETDPESLRIMVRAGARTVIAKRGPTGTAHVAWLVWEPSARDIVVWCEQYGLYAADAAVGEDRLLRIFTVTERALGNVVYPVRDRRFGAPVPASLMPIGHYDARNDDTATVALGLFQAATVNGAPHAGPVNVVSVPPRFTADFAPLTTVSVWSQRGVESGSVVEVPAEASSLALDGGRRIALCRYHVPSARFVPTPMPRRHAASERRPRPPLRRSPKAHKNSRTRSRIQRRAATKGKVMKPLNAHAKVVPYAQAYGDYCAATCVQMILGGMGVPTGKPGTQKLLDTSIRVINGPWERGNPAGVAYTINRYNSANAKQYRVRRTASPYKACSIIVNALSRYKSPSAVMVYGSGHWVVISGVHGEGDPEDRLSYSIDTFRMVDPALVDPKAPSARQDETYGAFLNTYFYGVYNYRDAHAFAYGDGRPFIIVTDERAKPSSRLQLPTAEAIGAAAPLFELDMNKVEITVSETARWIPDGKQGLPLRVQRLDRDDDFYFLIPFITSLSTANIVRLDKDGTYLGTAFDVTADSALFDAEKPLGLARSVATLGLNMDAFTSPASRVYVWSPSVQTSSPYKPLHAFSVKGTMVYTSFDGAERYDALFDHRTGARLNLKTPKAFLPATDTTQT